MLQKSKAIVKKISLQRVSRSRRRAEPGKGVCGNLNKGTKMIEESIKV